LNHRLEDHLSGDLSAEMRQRGEDVVLMEEVE